MRLTRAKPIPDQGAGLALELTIEVSGRGPDQQMGGFSNMGQSPLRSDQEPEIALRQLFQQHGYVRAADEERKQQDAKYKKGYEVRLVVKTEDELTLIRHWLEQVGLKPGKPFRKHNRLVQPIYGKAAVEWFLSEGQGKQ
jgi:hypothetical protein